MTYTRAQMVAWIESIAESLKEGAAIDVQLNAECSSTDQFLVLRSAVLNNDASR